MKDLLVTKKFTNITFTNIKKFKKRGSISIQNESNPKGNLLAVTEASYLVIAAVTVKVKHQFYHNFS